MDKQSGLGDQLLVGGYDLGEDIGALSRIGGGPATLDVTGITKSAHQRIGGGRDGAIAYTAFFNPSTDRAHDRLSALPRTDQLLTYCRGYGIGRPSACLNGKQLNYDGTRGDDGSFTFAVEAQGNGYGLEWTRQLTDGVRTDTEATNGSSVDFGTGPTAFGLQAYLQVLSLTGDDVTIILEESSDNGAGDAWAAVTGGAFAEVAAGPATQRIETARDQTVERYLRVVTTGTFTEVEFLVAVARNQVETRF